MLVFGNRELTRTASSLASITQGTKSVTGDFAHEDSACNLSCCTPFLCQVAGLHIFFRGMFFKHCNSNAKKKKQNQMNGPIHYNCVHINHSSFHLLNSFFNQQNYSSVFSTVPSASPGPISSCWCRTCHTPNLWSEGPQFSFDAWPTFIWNLVKPDLKKKINLVSFHEK